jgi:AcrR family transcriptional regulator
METKREDRRKSRTRRLLRESLYSLILEKGYDTLTVEEITQRADLGRTTFYLHYKDKEELLLESIDSLVNDLVESISTIPITAWKDLLERPVSASTNGKSPIQFIFEHAARNAVLYKIILRGEARYKATDRLRDIIIRTVYAFMDVRLAQERPDFHPEIPLDVFANFFAGALLGNLTWWLENDLLYTAEEMAGIFQRLFFQGARQVFGL